MSKELGKVSQKVILLLLSGLALSLSRSPNNYFRILRITAKAWREIDRKSLHRTIKNLYHSKLVETKENNDGTITLVLNEKGKKMALKYNLATMQIPKMKRWDHNWRIVLFDIPESKRRSRDILRSYLKRLKFFEFQKSVFAHPFDCKNEIEYIVEFYNLRPYVRFVIAKNIDNESHLKKHFHLL